MSPAYRAKWSKQSEEGKKEEQQYRCERCKKGVICLIHWKKKKLCASCWEKLYYGEEKEGSPAPLQEKEFRNTAI